VTSEKKRSFVNSVYIALPVCDATAQKNKNDIDSFTTVRTSDLTLINYLKRKAFEEHNTYRA
jgi:hypothetical protein